MTRDLKPKAMKRDWDSQPISYFVTFTALGAWQVFEEGSL